MSELKTLYKQISVYMGGRVAVMAIGLLSFPIFTRLLTVEEYGEMSFVMTAVNLATVFSKMGIQNGVLRFHEERLAAWGPDGPRRLYSTIVLGTAGVAAGITLLYAAAAGAGSFLIPAQVRVPLLIGGSLVFIRSLQSIQLAFFRAEERTKEYNFADIGLKVLVVTITLSLFAIFGKSVTNYVLGTVAAEATILMTIALGPKNRSMMSPGSFDLPFFREILAYSSPFIINELSGIVLDSGDRLMIGRMLGEEPLGYYSAAYNIVSYIQTFMLLPLSIAIFPVCMRIWNNQGRKATQEFLNGSMDHFLMACGLVMCGTLATAGDAIAFLASSKYQPAQHLLPPLLAGVLVYALIAFISAGLWIQKKSMEMALLVFYAAISNIVLNLILLPRMGIEGAAIATLVSYLFLILLLARGSFRYLPLKISWPNCVRYAIAAAASYALLIPLHFRSAVTGFLVKGLSSVILYACAILALDARYRRMVGAAVEKWRGSAA